MSKCTTFEEGIEGLREYAKGQTRVGCAYATLTEKDGVYSFVSKRSRPCYGELRRYGSLSTRPTDPHPGDLPHPLHEGRPVAVAVPLTYVSNDGLVVEAMKNTYLNPETSPWRSVLKDFEVTETGKYPALIIKDTAFDSTALVNLLLNLRGFGREQCSNRVKKTLAEGTISPIFTFLLLNSEKGRARNGQWSEKGWSIPSNGYFRASAWSAKKMLAGDVNPLSGGLWCDEFDYNRPFIHHLFTPSLDKEEHPVVYDGTKTLGEIYAEIRRVSTKTVGMKKIDDAWPEVLDAVLKKDSPSIGDILSAHREISNALHDWN